MTTPNPNRSVAIKNFLMHSTHPDLAALYHRGMECQVNVAQDGGERVSGEYMGRQWHKWQDPNTGQTWGSFRIPRNAKSEPEDNDTEMKFDISVHAEGIGMTGWNWVDRRSYWVAFDFDDITGHSDRHGQKMTPDQILEVQNAAARIPWVTVRKSTSGRGLHLYVFLEPFPTNNHTEHAAVARAILGKMSALTGFDFNARVDVCGHNMWVWHRKMQNTDGLTLLKAGNVLEEPPPNWVDHINVIKGVRRKTLPKFAEQSAAGDLSESDRLFNELTSQSAHIPLDDGHKKLITWLEENKAMVWWDSDHHMLVTHTFHLKEAHAKLGLKGLFDTIAQGTEYGNDQNCFLFPARRSSWTVRRFTPGVMEHSSWTQDGSGWTRCFFNHDPDLSTASRSLGGVEHTAGGFIFREAHLATVAADAMGIRVAIPDWLLKRRAKLRTHKDGQRLVVEIDQDASDSPRNGEMDDWINEKGKWKRIFYTPVASIPESESGGYDDLVRHLITENGGDYGWVIKRDGQWGDECYSNIKIAMKSAGIANMKEMELILGSSVMKPWKVVNRPFQPMFPGDREWNRDAAQFRFTPSQNKDRKVYPNWTRILSHVGQSLDAAVQENGWAQANAIKTGADYLKVWLASLFQHPLEPLPYLFLWGPQDSGKSIFHEAVSQLLTKGYMRADSALTNPTGFNAELRYAIICVIEETDLRKNKMAYSRIKDWVTARLLPIHEKAKTPVVMPNSTHWVQCSNHKDHCPIFPGDTRITMIHVPALDLAEMIPKSVFMKDLEKEAPDFLGELMQLELPAPASRLNIEVIRTQDKIDLEQANRTALEQFLEEKVHYVLGSMVSISDFYVKFVEQLDPQEIPYWTKQKISSQMDSRFPKGRRPSDSAWAYGNMSWEPFKPGDIPQPRLVAVNDKLRAEGKAK